MTISRGFLLYPDQWVPIASLSMEKRGLLLTALYAYHGVCDMPELDPATQMAFLFLKDRIDQNRRNREAIAERNRSNGQSGGRPPASPDKPSGPGKTQNNPKNPVGLQKPSGSDETQSGPENLYNGILYNEGENIDNSINQESSPTPYIPPSYSPQGGEEVRGDEPPNKFELSPPPQKKPRAQRTDYRWKDFAEIWEKYPQHNAEERAKKTWVKMVKAGEMADQKTLMAAVTWQVSYWKEQGRPVDKIPYLARWLSEKLWNDPLPTVQMRDRPWLNRGNGYGPRPMSREEATHERNMQTAREVLAEMEEEDRRREEGGGYR